MCVDPVTATAIAATTVAAGSTIYGGISQQRLANQQARGIEGQGLAAQRTAAREEELFRGDAERWAGRQRLSILASGVDPSSGSAAEVAADDARRIELDALMVRYGGESARRAAMSEALYTRQAGRAAAVGGFLNAGATVLSTAGDWGVFRKASPSPTTAPRPVTKKPAMRPAYG